MEITMKTTGKDFVYAICERLKRKNELLYDVKILNEIRELTWQEMNKIINLGKDTPRWKTEMESCQQQLTASGGNE